MVKMSEKKELNKRRKIALIGTFPPPIGGTSIHVMRLREKLVDNGYDVMVYDTHGTGKAAFDGFVSIHNYKKWITKYFFTMREDVIHSHTHEWKERAILSIGAKLHRKKMIFTFHSLRDEIEKLSFIEKICVKVTFLFCNKIICTSQHVKLKLIKWGCDEKKLTMISPYISPTKAEINECVVKELEDFRKDHEIIISANASNNDFYNGEDLYGLDMCIELTKDLRNKNINAGFIFAQTKVTNEKYFIELKNRIKEYNIEKNFYLITEPVSFIPVLMKSDIFVRPTNTDSWPLSIMESIECGRPVVASDVCERPCECTLFKTRDKEDLCKKVVNCIQSLNTEKEKISWVKNHTQTVDRIISVYEKER